MARVKFYNKETGKWEYADSAYGSGGTVTDEQIASAVEDYMAEHPVTGGCVLTVETITIDDSGEPVNIPVTGLTLDLASYNAKVGDGFYINPVVTPNNATNKAVTWKSNATNVATVNNSGYVECIAEGSAVITCTTVDGSFTATCSVSVSAVESGGEEGGETPVQKIQYTTMERIDGGIGIDGAPHTLTNVQHVVLPYTEGMVVRSMWKTNWGGNYMPLVLLSGDGAYSKIADYTFSDYTNGTETGLEATLTGLPADSTIIVNFVKRSSDNTMNEMDYYWYMPGSGTGGDSGDDTGGETEVTITSISATYSGGDVAVGTAVTDLTGIVVTAHYSDGSTATVTDYTLSGTIAEGSNTVTVSYGGKATTFTVTGVDESTGGETAGQKIQFSTLEINSGMMGPTGSIINMGNCYHVQFPYSEGMQVSTGTNPSWNSSSYPPIVVYDNGTYSLPEVTLVGSSTSVGGKYSTQMVATLTGYTENAVVYASFLAGGTLGSTLETNMDKADKFYYIPGGEA